MLSLEVAQKISMQAITSLLNQQFTEVVLEIMASLSRDFGVTKGRWPHFSYHLAAQYNGTLFNELKTVATTISPLTIRTSGLGIFTGAEPVVYVTIVRTPALARLHQQLWALGEQLGQYTSEYYSPAGWIPHITLTKITGRPYLLPEMIRSLSTREFHWEIPIDNLAILTDDQGLAQLKHRWTLEGS